MEKIQSGEGPIMGEVITPAAAAVVVLRQVRSASGSGPPFDVCLAAARRPSYHRSSVPSFLVLLRNGWLTTGILCHVNGGHIYS